MKHHHLTDDKPHRKHYFHSDGNGGLTMGKWTFGMITAIVAVLSFIISCVIQVVAITGHIQSIDASTQLAVKDNAAIHPIVIEEQRQIAVIQEQHKQFVAHQEEEDIRLQRIEDKQDKIYSALVNK